MAIIDTIGGWQVEEGDFIVINDDDGDTHEAEVLTLLTDEAEIYSNSTGDTLFVPFNLDSDYEVWGE